MPFEILKFMHIGSMFMATSLAVGPSLAFYLVARTGDPVAIRRAFAYATPIGQAGGACYGLGIVLAVAAALTGSLDITAHWLLTAYVLVVLLGLNGLVFERWSHRVGRSVANTNQKGALRSLRRSTRQRRSSH